MTNIPPVQPLGYLGEVSVPLCSYNRAPLTTDIHYDIGTIWIDKAGQDSYELVGKPANIANWIHLGGTPGQVETVSGNDAVIVGPDPATQNIRILGNNVQGINITGNAVTYTMTVAGIDSSDIQKGVVELATNDETITGTSAVLAVTPAGLNAKLGPLTNHAVLVGAGANVAITAIAVGLTGQMLCGITGADPVFQAFSDGDFAFLSNTGGVIRTLNIQNTVDGAGSQADLNITVAGGASGDVWQNFGIAGGRSYALGIDNSDNDKLKLTTNAAGGSTPSTGTTRVEYDPVTFAPFELINFYVDQLNLQSTTAGRSSLYVNNYDNNAASFAFLDVTTIGNAAGDPQYGVSTSLGGNWVWGADNGVGGHFYLSADSSNADITATNPKCIEISRAGAVMFPSTPAFFARLSADVANATGDGTQYYIIFDTERFDVAGNYNNGTGVFTAPEPGKYYFHVTVAFSNIAAHNDTWTMIETTGYSYLSNRVNIGVVQSGTGYYIATHSVLCDMALGDTARVKVLVGGGAKTVTVKSDATVAYTYFSGKLSC